MVLKMQLLHNHYLFRGVALRLSWLHQREMHKRGSSLLQQQILDFMPEWDIHRRENLLVWWQHMEEVDGKEGRVGRWKGSGVIGIFL
jgi:hypothetical protein